MTVIREVRDGELDICADVIRRGFGTVAKDFGLTIENVPTNGAFIKTERLAADREKGNQMFVLTENETIVGFMQLERADDEKYYLQKISVLPECRHRGYGKELLRTANEKVRAVGGRKIEIAIIEENEQLKKWYIKNGFTHTGTRKFDHLPFTVGFMELNIESLYQTEVK